MKFERLKEIRKNHKLIQKEVAQKLNIALETYAMNEIGQDTISLHILTKFCDEFNTSVDYIFEFTDKINYPQSKFHYDKEKLRTRLKESRLNNNYTQEDIGKFLNINHSVWCRYEQGVTTISTIFLYYYCKKLNVSADYLLGRINEPMHFDKKTKHKL